MLAQAYPKFYVYRVTHLRSHFRELGAIVGHVGDLLRNDEVTLGIGRCLYVVAAHRRPCPGLSSSAHRDRSASPVHRIDALETQCLSAQLADEDIDHPDRVAFTGVQPSPTFNNPSPLQPPITVGRRQMRVSGPVTG